mmetsp:Transcript_21105/g.47327  ORF Transcript_21105/g.47327 Transcript_21105/m.47327 type:complete len:454 (-) Transcript_21105:116-1477(-)
MLSKLGLHTDGYSVHGARGKHTGGIAFAVVREIVDKTAAVLPGGGSCGVRCAASLPGQQKADDAEPDAPRIRTTVTALRRHGLRIQTTVQQRRSRSDGQATQEKEELETAGLQIVLRKCPASKSHERHDLARMAVESLALLPLTIHGPLQLLSPWSGLAILAGPPAPSPYQTYQRQLNMMNPQMQKEEEQFAELIFPGFDANSFMWQVTCCQTAEFILSMMLGHQRANPTPCVLYRLGASWGPALAQGQIWRLVTPVMLHANLTHLLFNVFFQLRMGFGMEKQFGREKMIMIYFACGVIGNLLSAANDPFKLAVGASTAGFGLIGVWLAEILLSWEILGPARERTILWIVFMLISVTTMSTMTPNMDLVGHLGGALGGFLLSIIISDMKEEDRPAWYSEAKVAAVLGMATLLTGASAKIFLGPTGPLPDCPLFQALATHAGALAETAAKATTQ